MAGGWFSGRPLLPPPFGTLFRPPRSLPSPPPEPPPPPSPTGTQKTTQARGWSIPKGQIQAPRLQAPGPAVPPEQVRSLGLPKPRDELKPRDLPKSRGGSKPRAGPAPTTAKSNSNTNTVPCTRTPKHHHRHHHHLTYIIKWVVLPYRSIAYDGMHVRSSICQNARTSHTAGSLPTMSTH